MPKMDISSTHERPCCLDARHSRSQVQVDAANGPGIYAANHVELQIALGTDRSWNDSHSSDGICPDLGLWARTGALDAFFWRWTYILNNSPN